MLIIFDFLQHDNFQFIKGREQLKALFYFCVMYHVSYFLDQKGNRHLHLLIPFKNDWAEKNSMQGSLLTVK